MRSLYFWRMRSASALRFSNGCSSLNLDRIFAVEVLFLWLCSGAGVRRKTEVGAQCCVAGEMRRKEGSGERLRGRGGRQQDGTLVTEPMAYRFTATTQTHA
jgi:hypothetical protein